MPGFLLDTNILSDLIHQPAGTVAKHIATLPARRRRDLCTSIIVAAELRYGAEKRNSARLSQRVEEILDTIEVLPFTRDADHTYGRIRAALEAEGRLIGANDLLIAAHALEAGYILVTDNEREFSRVSGLLVENWRRAVPMP